jgi:LMBR1 domain-containing protein 1
MMLVFLGISIELLTILPSYTTFGSQTFKNSESLTVKCTLENFNSENCTMSNLSSIFNRISVSIPLFSTIIYLFNWLFLAVFLVYFVNSATSKPNSTFEDETEEDEEESLLL